MDSGIVAAELAVSVVAPVTDVLPVRSVLPLTDCCPLMDTTPINTSTNNMNANEPSNLARTERSNLMLDDLPQAASAFGRPVAS